MAAASSSSSAGGSPAHAPAGAGGSGGGAYGHHRSRFGDTTLTKVFVGGLAWETPSEGLREHFQGYGEILEAVVITDRETGRSKGYGFVIFRDPEAAQRAVQNPNPVIAGRRANCNIASMGPPRPAQGRGRGGGAGRGPHLPDQPPLGSPYRVPPQLAPPQGYLLRAPRCSTLISMGTGTHLIIHTNRYCTILKCCSITTLSCMAHQAPLQDLHTNTWVTCPVARVREPASHRCSSMLSHSFSSQQHRWRVLSHQGLRFLLISDSSYPHMQSRGNQMMHPALDQLSKTQRLKLQVQTARKHRGL